MFQGQSIQGLELVVIVDLKLPHFPFAARRTRVDKVDDVAERRVQEGQIRFQVEGLVGQLRAGRVGDRRLQRIPGYKRRYRLYKN
jgi:hypothetical protein